MQGVRGAQTHRTSQDMGMWWRKKFENSAWCPGMARWRCCPLMGDAEERGRSGGALGMVEGQAKGRVRMS